MKNYILYLCLSMTLFISCDSFLSEPPEKKDNLEIKTVEAVDLLLNHYNILFDRSRERIFASDSYGLYKDYYLVKPSLFTGALKYIVWLPDLLPSSATYYWEQEWNKISYANTVLNTIDQLEGTEVDKVRLIQDAHFLRAYEYYNMMTMFCLPYSEETKDALGLPLKKTLAFDESFKRSSLEETKNFIEEELTEALKTTIQRNEDLLFRISLPAVQAFAARFYLYIHDYTKAEDFASKALKAHSELVNIDNYFTPYNWKYTAVGKNYYGPNAPTDYKYPEFYYARVIYNHTSNAVPSQKLVNLYDQTNDARYEHFIVEDYSLNRAQTEGWDAYWQFGSIGIIHGPTTAEMMLIMAECLARKGETAQAITYLNNLRSTRYKAGTYTDLKASDFANKKEIVQFIIDERQREFPFAHRWDDIKRINSDPQNVVDKITITREFYQTDGVTVDESQTKTYTLAPGDPRFAWPISQLDIELSNGQLVQNPYE